MWICRLPRECSRCLGKAGRAGAPWAPRALYLGTAALEVGLQKSGAGAHLGSGSYLRSDGKSEALVCLAQPLDSSGVCVFSAWAPVEPSLGWAVGSEPWHPASHTGPDEK